MIQGASRSACLNESNLRIPPPTLSRCVPFNTGPLADTTGHLSVVFSEESQVPSLLQLLEPLRAELLKSATPTDVVTDRYNVMPQERLQDTAWSQCASWFRVAGRGRIVGLFPGSLVLLWW
jgi:hypothetical protein